MGDLRSVGGDGAAVLWSVGVWGWGWLCRSGLVAEVGVVVLGVGWWQRVVVLGVGWWLWSAGVWGWGLFGCVVVRPGVVWIGGGVVGFSVVMKKKKMVTASWG